MNKDQIPYYVEHVTILALHALEVMLIINALHVLQLQIDTQVCLLALVYQDFMIMG